MKPEKELYDVGIIGTGPAGLTAAVYCTRYKLKTIVLGKEPGGLAGGAYEIHNFPSYESILGNELMAKMMNQAKKFGAEIKLGEVSEISGNDGNFEITIGKNKFYSKKIILATGSERRKLNLPKEKELTGKGISYCATCDAGFYKDKTVGIVGGGNAALSASLLLSKYAKKVYIIYRQQNFCGAEPMWVEEIKKYNKINPIFERNVVKLIGEKNLEGIELDRGEFIKLDGLFVEIGSVPNVKLAERLGLKLDCENIAVNKYQKTSEKGIFATGDVTNNPLKQIITACGEGAIAANSAYEELKNK